MKQIELHECCFDWGFGNDAFFLVAPLQAFRDCWTFSMWWMWYWRPVVATARAVGGSLCPYGVLPCLSVRSVFGCRVVVRAHVPMTVLCGGLAYKTKQMAHPLAVAWGPPASHTAIWQCGLVAWTSCAVLPACGLLCSWFGTALVADQWWLCTPRLPLWNVSDLARIGLFETRLLSNVFPFSWVLDACENVLFAYQQQRALGYILTWCISAVVAVDWSYSFHPKPCQTGQDWLLVNTPWLVLIALSVNSLLLPCLSSCKFFWHPC